MISWFQSLQLQIQLVPLRLGKFGVVMADPPWDINIDLPYGTMSGEERAPGPDV
jgi:N6-adenosine-specific RNA methylase IME4